MRVNVYAEEMTDRVELVTKEGEGGRTFVAVRFFTYLPVTLPTGEQVQGAFIHREGDDDSAAVTFWGKRDFRALLRKALGLLDDYYDGVFPHHDSPVNLPSAIDVLLSARRRIGSRECKTLIGALTGRDAVGELVGLGVPETGALAALSASLFEGGEEDEVEELAKAVEDISRWEEGADDNAQLLLIDSALSALRHVEAMRRFSEWEEARKRAEERDGYAPDGEKE